jgi:hypothetical protein
VNANDVPWRELLHQKEIFFVLVHAAHAKQTGRRIAPEAGLSFCVPPTCESTQILHTLPGA